MSLLATLCLLLAATDSAAPAATPAKPNLKCKCSAASHCGCLNGAPCHCGEKEAHSSSNAVHS